MNIQKKRKQQWSISWTPRLFNQVTDRLAKFAFCNNLNFSVINLFSGTFPPELVSFILGEALEAAAPVWFGILAPLLCLMQP